METNANKDETDLLLIQAKLGKRQAIDQLLGRHRDRLRKMVYFRMDQRLSPRVDPSDVVQEALLVANRQIAGYLEDPTVDFYPWLRDIAWKRLIDLQRKHVHAERRSVNREVARCHLSDESVGCLAQFFAGSQTGPVEKFARQELRERVRSAMQQIGDDAREVLLLRFAEQLTARQMAQIVGVSESAVKGRLVRAIEKLREELDSEFGESKQ